jgi:hypothetical protein
MKLLSIDSVIPVVLIITSDHCWLLGTKYHHDASF